MKPLQSTLLILLSAGHAAAQASPSELEKVEAKSFPKWLRFSVEERLRWESHAAFDWRPNTSDGYLLHRLRMSMELRLPGKVRLVAQGQDARVFAYLAPPSPSNMQNAFDIRQVFVEYGAGDSHAQFRVGRQSLVFGSGRLVADPDWINVGRSFDAARATLRANGVTLDAFAASVVNVDSASWDQHKDGSNFHGLYGGLTRLVPNASIEPYLFWRLDRAVQPQTGVWGKTDHKTGGFRWAGKLPRGFDYETEMAVQRGWVLASRQEAWAAHSVAGRTLASRWKPRLYAEYNYASGDANAKDGQHGTFDQLYASAHDKTGLADQFAWQNSHHIRAGAEFTPDKKWKLCGAYNSFWLASASDGIYRAGKLVFVAPAGNTATHIGQELDAQAFLSLAAGTKLNFGAGWIVPGAFLKNAKPDISHTFTFLQVTHRF